MQRPGEVAVGGLREVPGREGEALVSRSVGGPWQWPTASG